MKLKYTGLSHVRIIEKADFVQYDVTDQDRVVWNETNNWVAEVSATAGSWLLQVEGMDFHKATKDEEKQPDMTRVGSKDRLSSALPIEAAPDDPLSGQSQPDDAGSAIGRAKRS